MIIPEDDGVDMTKGLLFYCLEGDIIRKLCGGDVPQFSSSNLPKIVLKIDQILFYISIIPILFTIFSTWDLYDGDDGFMKLA